MLTTAQIRDVRQSIPKLRRRLGELNEGFQNSHLRDALESLYERSLPAQQLDLESLTEAEVSLLLLSLEQTLTRILVADLEQLELSQQNAAGN